MKYELYDYDPNPGAGSFVIAPDKKFRIQILTENVFRFEYSKSGQFEDRPTLTVVNRNFTINNGIPKFTQFVQDGKMVILTSQFNITYVIGSGESFVDEALLIKILELQYPDDLRVVCINNCPKFNGDSEFVWSYA